MPLWLIPEYGPELDINDNPTGNMVMRRYTSYQAKGPVAEGHIFGGYGEGEYDTPPAHGYEGKLLDGVKVNMKVGEIVQSPKQSATDKIKKALNPAKKRALLTKADPLAKAQR